MIIPNQDFGNPDDDLYNQERLAQNRVLEPADPVEFLKWVRESSRDHNNACQSLKEKHAELCYADNLARIGLKRLESLTLANQRLRLQNVEDLHRSFCKANEGIGYTLEQCDNTIHDLIINYQMVAESLKSPLADRHKKIGIQKELGLRLRDVDDALKQSQVAVKGQAKLNKKLSETIQLLLSESCAQLPAHVREKITKEDEIARIAIKLRGTLEKGQDAINPIPFDPQSQKPMTMAISLADKQSSNSKGNHTDLSGLSDTTSSVSLIAGSAALVVGVIVGILVFYKPKF